MKRATSYGLAVALMITAVSVWLFWRFTGPVTVEVVGEIRDLPFTVEVYPSVVQARPGEMVKVIYRIHNTGIQPLEAFGEILIEPGSAEDQIELFLSQCGGYNTFQNNAPAEYEVIFRAEPAGLFGSRHLTLIHRFTPVIPGNSRG
jgi:cytochrome c oxidase assembly protein Cox11